MSRRPLSLVTAVILSTLAFAVPAEARAQYPYKLVDLGTLGGPQSDVGNQPVPVATRQGAFVGTADTTVSDPFSPSDNPAFSGDPYVQHTFVWRDGTITDLGALGPQPGDNSSWPASVNARGDIAGSSDNGTMDPLGYEEANAVLWKDGRIINLGTLGGTESLAFFLNNRDQVVGAASNTITDPVSMFGVGTQTRAFLWRDGTMRDLGTLGGPDAAAFFINDAGQTAGNSYTNSTPNSVTGSPTTHPFLWQNGHMKDLGTLGGTQATTGPWGALNDRGEVVGQSNLAGDLTFHPFLWKGHALTDLGAASWINDAGQVVGWADTTHPLTPPLGEPGDQLYQAFLWDHGVMTNLGTAPGEICSTANSINNSGQVVGNAGHCHGAVDAFLYDHGSTMNLNDLIAPSPLHLKEAFAINDRGEIMGIGVLPGGNQHAYVLIPGTEPRS
jgi:probable HAF family extracellular repeat protein